MPVAGGVTLDAMAGDHAGLEPTAATRSSSDLVWRLELCGDVRLTRDGAVQERLAGRQCKRLLAYLALNRERAVPRDELVEAVWPYGAPDAAACALRALLSRTRSAIGPGALVGRGCIRLQPPPGAAIDVDEAAAAIRAAVASAREGRWLGSMRAATRASALLRSELLAGDDTPWIAATRRDLEQLRSEALTAVIAAALELGGDHLGSAERAGRELLTISPYDEPAHSLLIDVLHRSGRHSEALLVYDGLRGRLRDDLGSFPGAELRAVHARLVSGEPRERLPRTPLTTTVRDCAPVATDAVQHGVALLYGESRPTTCEGLLAVCEQLVSTLRIDAVRDAAALPATAMLRLPCVWQAPGSATAFGQPMRCTRR
jgi:DNA-binding SARP family transcriptional activator